MTKKLRNLKVKQKLQSAFRTILIAFIIAALMSLAGIAMINANVNRFYNESYSNMELQLEICKDIQMAEKYVLWAITTTDSGQKDLIANAENYAKNVETNVLALEKSFGDKDMTATLDEAFRTMETERTNIVSALNKGDNSKAYQLFNGTYNEASAKVQNVLLQIGEKADQQATTAYSRIANLVPMVVGLLIIVTAVCIWLCIKLSATLTSLLLEPIKELQNVAHKLKKGELDIAVERVNDDELGELAEDFQGSCAQIKLVIDDMGYLLSEMAKGNFEVHSQASEEYVGDFEALITSIRKMNRQLNSTLSQINVASSQVMSGSGQLANSAQALAEGATEQASAIEELMATIGNVTIISEQSAESADEAASTAKASAEDAAKSREEINALTGAMERINATSKEIENIIASIEDIASQTNLLSLNASIEAARAGEAGRGFAVVADQIGKLAADSAQSAVTTRELISKSLLEIENGSNIVEHTMDAIATVLENMAQFSNMASGVAESSKSQATMLKQVEQGVEQISTVVESNSATAEETSAISEELSAQAQTLEQMVAAFELRKN